MSRQVLAFRCFWQHSWQNFQYRLSRSGVFGNILGKTFNTDYRVQVFLAKFLAKVCQEVCQEVCQNNTPRDRRQLNTTTETDTQHTQVKGGAGRTSLTRCARPRPTPLHTRKHAGRGCLVGWVGGAQGALGATLTTWSRARVPKLLAGPGGDREHRADEDDGYGADGTRLRSERCGASRAHTTTQRRPHNHTTLDPARQ